MDNRFSKGDIVQHFKRELLSAEEREGNMYLYEIVGVATHSETGEQMMVYKPLYGDHGMYVRPLEMFLSEVDHAKYPNVKQQYRFEKAHTVPLSLVLEAVEMASDEYTMYLDVQTPEIIALTDYFDEYDEEELEELEEKIDDELGIRYFRLPYKFDIDDYSIMESFIEDLPAGEERNQLSGSIRGKGAFHRFRENILRLGIENAWYEYRDEAYKQIARDWCEENGIYYTE